MAEERKLEALARFQELESYGFIPPRHYTLDDSLEEMQLELEILKRTHENARKSSQFLPIFAQLGLLGVREKELVDGRPDAKEPMENDRGDHQDPKDQPEALPRPVCDAPGGQCRQAEVDDGNVGHSVGMVPLTGLPK